MTELEKISYTKSFIDIFRQDNISNYKKQTQARDELKAQFRIRIAEINREIQSGSFSVSEALVQKLEELSVSLEKHKIYYFPENKSTT